MGLVAGDGGTAVWPALIGPARAKEYLLTGDPVDAATAERIGPVNRVVPDDEVLRHAWPGPTTQPRVGARSESGGRRGSRAGELSDQPVR